MQEIGASLIPLNSIQILNPCSPAKKDGFISQLLLWSFSFFSRQAANQNPKVNYDFKKIKSKKQQQQQQEEGEKEE